MAPKQSKFQLPGDDDASVFDLQITSTQSAGVVAAVADAAAKHKAGGKLELRFTRFQVGGSSFARSARSLRTKRTQ